MKKIVIAATSTAVLATTLVLPGLIGDYTKTNIDTFISQMQQPGLQVSWDSYQQGWFDSHGILNVRIDISGAETEPTVVDLKYRVTLGHGPITLHNGLKFALMTWHAEMITPENLIDKINVKDQPLYVQDGQISFLRNIDFEQYTPAFTYTDEITTKVGGSDGSGTIEDSVFVYNGGVDYLSFEQPGHTSFEIEALAVSVNSVLPNRQQAGGIMPGTISLKVSKIHEGNTFLANDVEILNSINLKDDNLLANMSMRYTTKKLAIGELSLDDIVVDTTLHNYSLTYQKLIQQALLDYEHSSSATKTPTELWTNGKVQEALKALLAGQPTIDVSQLSFSVPKEGTFSGKLSLKLDNYDIDVNQLINPMMLVQNIDAQASLSAAKALAVKLASFTFAPAMDPSSPTTLAMAELFLDNLANQGVLSESGKSHYTTELSLKKGHVTVNGKPLPSIF